MAWIDVQDVAAHLGIDDEDLRLADVTEASLDYCQRQRPDLDPENAAPSAVKLAAILYAAYLFRLRTSPQAVPGFDELGQYETTGDLMSNIYRLLGNRRPVAR